MPTRLRITRLLVATLVCSCASKEPTPSASGDDARPTPRAEIPPPPPVVQGAAATAGSMSSLGEPPRAVELGEPLTAACEVDSTNPAVVIEEAGLRYRRGDFAAAYACARMAVDMAPQAVAAHHLQAAALTGLARYDEAQVAFAMALALDPNDPETLADVADFYINILPPKSRQTIHVGLQYARRGGMRAQTGRRFDASLQGRLLLLEAEALNDLDEPDRALARTMEAMERAPGLPGAEHERAVSLFRLLRFDESEEGFLRVLDSSADDAYAHHHLGLIYERRGRVADAEAHFLRARRLAPADFPAPVILGREEFRAEVERAVSELPEELRDLLALAELQLVDLPSDEDLAASIPPFSPTILGLYRGLPVGIGREAEIQAPARAVVLYRMNLGRAVHSRAELNVQIRHTLRHEIGHLQGYDEDELRRRGLE